MYNKLAYLATYTFTYADHHISVACNHKVTQIPICPHFHASGETIVQAGFEMNNSAIETELSTDGVSRRFSELATPDLNGAAIQCKATIMLRNGERENRSHDIYHITVTGEILHTSKCGACTVCYVCSGTSK